MNRPQHAKALLTAATIVLTSVVALSRSAGNGEGAPPQQGATQAGTPATIPASVVAAAETIANDPQVLALIKDQSTDAAAKARWNQFLEIVRIPSPSRQENLKAAEIHRRLVEEWGFTRSEVMTRADGIIESSDTAVILMNFVMVVHPLKRLLRPEWQNLAAPVPTFAPKEVGTRASIFSTEP